MGCLKKIDDFVFCFFSLCEKCIKFGEFIGNIRFEFLCEVYSVLFMKMMSSCFNWSMIFWFIILFVVVVFWSYFFLENVYEFCFFEFDVVFLNDIVCKLSKCLFFCEGVNEVFRVFNLLKEEFIVKYVYSGRFVVIIDVVKNWLVVGKFSF